MAVSEKVVRQMLDDMVEEVSSIERAINAKYEGRATAAEKERGELTQTVKDLKRDLDELRSQMNALQAEKASLAEQVVTARADAASLREQLATQGKTSPSETLIRVETAEIKNLLQGLSQQLEQKVSAGVAAAFASRPTPEPPEYEMQVTGRDPNNRLTSIRLRPAKKE